MKIVCNWTRALSAAILTTAALSVSAGTELIQNGDFEAGNATDQSWGSYANKSGYSNPGWTVSSSGGLSTTNTWMTAGLTGVGKWALFLQNSGATAYQDVEVPAAGTYRLSFHWTSRPSHDGQTVHVKFGDALLDTFTTYAKAVMVWQKDIEIPAAGTYRLMFETQTSDGDRATCFDAVSLRALDNVRTWTGGGSSTSISDAGNWGGTPGETLTLTSDDYLVFGTAATVTVPEDVFVKGIKITGDGNVTFSGSHVINVASDIYSDASTDMVFNNPVAFASTYFVVKQGHGSVKFPGGVTATYPENTVRSGLAKGANIRTLDGDFTFTGDWTVPTDGEYPWIVTANSTVRGQVFQGVGSSTPILLIDEGGYACFTTIYTGAGKGEISVNGMLEATTAILVATSGTIGREGNIGTVKAPRVAKYAGTGIVYSRVPNYIIGAGGIGMELKDYYFYFYCDTTITASDNFNFLGLLNGNDWGIRILNRMKLTINVPENLTVTCGIGISGDGDGCIRKTGAGTLVMTDTFNEQSGFAKVFGSNAALLGSMLIDEGTLKVEASGQLGSGVIRLAEGTRMEVSPGVTLSNRIDGKGVLQLANGVTIQNAGNPWRVGSVTFVTASDAVTVTAPSGATAPLAFLTGVSAADLSHFTCAAGTLAVKGRALMLVDAAAATDYVWNGASGADWSTPGNWLVNGAAATAAPTSSDTIRFENDAPVTVGGTTALQVTKVITTSGADVTFACPVQFASTYNVQNAAIAPVFAGGATATIPDASLSSANIPSHEFRGRVTFTDDWTVPDQAAGNPFVVAEYSSITGQTVTASAYSSVNYHLRIDKGATATFNTVDVKNVFVFKLNGGRLVATGNINMWQNDCGQFLDSNIGTVEANAIIRSAPGYNNINFYITDMWVGSGGFGMYRKDYNLQLQRSSRLTATADLAIHQPIAEDGPKDGDWGILLNGYTFTINTAGHTVTFDSWIKSSGGTIVKEGEGEMIMQSRQKLHTGGTILKGGLTTVRLPGALGVGTTTVNSGATLRFTDEVGSFAYPIVVKSGATLIHGASIEDSSTLTLEAGTTLKPAQNTFFMVSADKLFLPGTGTVAIDMTDFSFANGIAVPVLGGVGAGDAPKFTALVPAGITGGFSVSNGILYYTAVSGGSTAGDLFWHPEGDSTWSTSVAAWTNAAGAQVIFTPYANVTVADAATISLPADVDANNITVSADSDVAINGAGGIGGTGTLTKTGDGTLTFNAQGGLDGQPVIVSNGVFKVGEDLVDHALGATVDASPIVVADGGTFDINYNNSTVPNDVTRSKVTRDKLVRIAGDGFEGQGAIVNNNQESQRALSTLVLDDDASVGGTARFDVRGGLSSSDFARYNASIYGPNKTLTVKNTATFGIVSSDITLGSLVITNGGVVQIEGSGTYNFSDGVHLADGKLIFYSAGFGSVPIIADSGSNILRCNSGAPTVNSPITVAPGATLTHEAGSVVYGGTVTGTLGFTGGYMYFTGGAPANGFTVNGSPYIDGTRVYMRQSGTFTGADIAAQILCVADVNDTTVDVVFNNSRIDVRDVFITWGCATKSACPSGSISLGSGTVVNCAKLAIGDDGTRSGSDRTQVFSIDGGTLNLTNNDFFVAHNSPNAKFIMNSGVANVTKATIRLRNNSAALGGYNNSEFIQNGGTFNYGGAGFTANYEDNSDEGQIVLKGGEFNASANWSIPHWIPTYFKPGDENGWTLNQANGTTATWNTALLGDGDVTLNGAATLVGNKEVQGAVGGKWTIGEGFTAGLEGAASLLGGLDIGEGASVTVDIATNRCAVFTARDFSAEPTSATCITNRFNRAIGATTRGTITHDESFLFTYYAQANRPFGNMNYTGAYAVGQFYVEEGKAGEWTFKGKCDDWVLLWIDGELVMASSGRCVEANGTKNLSVGWHSFRHIATDNGGAFGASNGNAYETLGYKDGSGTMSSFARFNVENLKMRPGADFGDPNNANTVCWSHYKGDKNTVTASTFKNDFPWDYRSITNSVQKMQWYGNSDKTWINEYNVNRYDGWFYVTAENADKEWTFRTQYDDRAALWIDDVDTGLTGSSSTSPLWKTTLSKGWHKFRIQLADFTGSAGPWSGKGFAVSYQVADGPETLFSEQTLALSVCPDGYIQGDVVLASNATLSNTASENAASVLGNITAIGTGATVNGKFKFDGGALTFSCVDPAERDLTAMLAFANQPEDYLADVGAIAIDFAAKPTRSKVKVCPAGGLTAQTAAQKVRVTVDAEPVDHFQCVIEDGDLKVRLGSGTVIYVR